MLLPSVSNKPQQVDLEEYLEKRKRIIDRYMSSLKDNHCPPRFKPVKIPSTSSKGKKAPSKKSDATTFSTSFSEIDNNGPSATILKDILSAKSKDGQVLIEIFNEDEECDGKVADMESSSLTAQNLKFSESMRDSNAPVLECSVSVSNCTVTKVPAALNSEFSLPVVNSDVAILVDPSILSIPGQESFIPSLDCLLPVVNHDTPVLERSVPVSSCSIVILESTASTVGSSVPLQESNQVCDQKKAALRLQEDRSAMQRAQNRASTLDAFLVRRQEKCKKFSHWDKFLSGYQEKTRSCRIPEEMTKLMEGMEEERKRRSQEAYNYLFNFNK